MQWYHVVIGVAAVISLALSYKTPRAVLWVVLLSASFAVSVVYVNMFAQTGALRPTVVAFFCDALVYLCIREFHKERWEMVGLGSVAMLMVIVNMLQSWGHIVGVPPVLSSSMYAISLEALNIIAFMMIGGIGLIDRISTHATLRQNIVGGYNSSVRAIASFAHAKTNASQPLRKW